MDVGGFSLDQLMELAGVSVSQAGTYCKGTENGDVLWLICGDSISFPSYK